MKFGDKIFSHVCNIEPNRLSTNQVEDFFPQSRYKNAKDLKLHKYGSGPFCKFKIPTNYKISGVYLVQVNEKIKYVGECQSLSDRFNAGYGNISPRNCFEGGQSTNCKVNSYIYQEISAGNIVSIWFYSMENTSKQLRCDLENKLYNQLIPEWNA